MGAPVKLLLRLPDSLRQRIAQCLPHVLPFADAASAGLPLPRLLRLSLFQVSVGLAAALMVGTLNRVMIVELHMAAWPVSYTHLDVYKRQTGNPTTRCSTR